MISEKGISLLSVGAGAESRQLLFSDGIWDQIIVDSETHLSQLYEQQGTTFNVICHHFMYY